VRALCDRYGIVYIADEVMCGLRAGRLLVRVLSSTAWCRDLITFAKGLELRVRPGRRG